MGRVAARKIVAVQLVRLQDAARHEAHASARPAALHSAHHSAHHATDVALAEPVAVYDLLAGREGGPDNHRLQLEEAQGEANASRPRRHNFEQVRVVLEGSFGCGPGLVQPAGSVGYFCEGTTHAQESSGRSVALVLQLGGPSGAGFMSRRQVNEGVAALRERGRFEDGQFTWFDAQGIKQHKDCYEAVWEQVNGRPIHYPRPQYGAPVLIDPERFAWVRQPFSSGVWLRTLGRFNDRGLALTQLKLAAGAELVLPRGDQVLLLCCLHGGGRVEERPYERLSTVRVEVDETPRLKARRESLFFGFELPRFG